MRRFVTKYSNYTSLDGDVMFLDSLGNFLTWSKENYGLVFSKESEIVTDELLAKILTDYLSGNLVRVEETEMTDEEYKEFCGD